MSEPPFTTPPQPPLLLPSATHHHPLLPATTTATVATTTTTAATSSSSPREYRKGNWTIEETLVLITAKKLDDERRSKPNLPLSSKPAELRWKWVENYCCAHGCIRSQNQCNDKWDNLLRDYKKVREYQSRSSNASDSSSQTNPSYWTMERHQRKDQNLPSNMSFEVYEALNEVVQRKYSNALQPPQQQRVQQQPQQQPQQQQYFCMDSSAAVPVTVRPPDPPAAPAGEPLGTSGSESSSGTQSSEKFEANTKRRKVKNLGSSIRQSASILAETIRSCEEKRDKQHQELMELEHRRLRLEETQIEVNRQGVANVVAALNNLSSAIQSLISDRT